MELLEKAEQNILSESLVPHASGVLVAVSGGVDSMVLLEVLHRLSSKYHWNVHVGHFNHQLRQEQSDQDELFVRSESERRALPFHAGHGDVREHSRQTGVSIEMAARELRYQYLIRTALGNQLQQVAAAHHADDQVETFWLRILRGDVGPGSAGMRWKRHAAAHTPLLIVRPFLNVTKDEIQEFAEREKVKFREDATNAETHFQRNRVRHEVLPTLANYQPRLEKVTLRCADILGAEKDFLSKTASAWLVRREVPFGELHSAVQREIVRLQLLQAALRPDFELIEDLRLKPGQPITVEPGKEASRDETGLIHVDDAKSPIFLQEERSISLEHSGAAEFGQNLISWELLDGRQTVEEGTEWFDADSIEGNVTLRYWRPGDRYQPIGTTHSVKLQDAFTNLRIPAARRRTCIVAVAQNSGEIFWVEGLRIAERFKVTPQTRVVIKWSWKPKVSSSTLT